jgi:hypothetical protein
MATPRARRAGGWHNVVPFYLLAILLVTDASAAAWSQDVPIYRERVEVRVFTVDVHVTDREGRPLTDLAAEDFDLRVAGEPVAISNFSRVINGRLPEAAAEHDAQPGAHRTSSMNEPPVTWAVYLDQRDVARGVRNAALRDVAAMLTASMRSDDEALVGIFDGNRLRIRMVPLWALAASRDLDARGTAEPAPRRFRDESEARARPHCGAGRRTDSRSAAVIRPVHRQRFTRFSSAIVIRAFLMRKTLAERTSPPLRAGATATSGWPRARLGSSPRAREANFS